MKQNLQHSKSVALLGYCKLKRAVMHTLLILVLLMGATAAMAQTNVYMHSGTQNVSATGINFYDSGGPSSSSGNYFWEKFYKNNENSTLTFKDGTNAIEVTFNTFQGWTDTGYPDYTLMNLGNAWSARLNDDYLYIYDGENAADDKLLVTLTGNIKNSFKITTNGPITFKFVSGGQYTGEGWFATVKSVTTAPALNAPIVSKDECGDYVNIFNPNLGSDVTVYYTTDGTNPTTSSQEYTGPIEIDLSDASASVNVKAICASASATSTATSQTFTHADQRPTPGVPTITITGNSVKLTPATNPGLEETYNIMYTTDGSDPTATNGTLLTAPWDAIEWHTPNTTFKAVTIAQKANCNSLVSAVVTEQFGNVKVPNPEFSEFTTGGTTTITCSMPQATIYYTTDGTEPTTNNHTGYGMSPLTTEAVTVGSTVKAFAHYNADGYDDSDVVSIIYVPEGGSGVVGDIVLLDDREDHSRYIFPHLSQISPDSSAHIKISFHLNSLSCPHFEIISR